MLCAIPQWRWYFLLEMSCEEESESDQSLQKMVLDLQSGYYLLELPSIANQWGRGIRIPKFLPVRSPLLHGKQRSLASRKHVHTTRCKCLG
jgi:hypothetical protein